MDGYVRKYNQALKRYDAELYAQRHASGAVVVMQKGYRYIPYEVGSEVVHVLSSSPTYVFALTDNWTTQGNPIDLGIDRVLDKVRECDYRKRENLIKELEETEEKANQTKRRDVRNNAEAFFSDQRSRFKKATGDILTHSMAKVETKAQKNRRLKDGNH